MQTKLADFIKNTPEGREADAILRKCVHCGFCTATCPTYQLLGDELDGPRGRIYLIKRVLEGAEVDVGERAADHHAAPGARFMKRVCSRANASFTVPVGPLRCLAMMISAMLLGSAFSSRL